MELSINQYHANHVTIINLLSDLNVARYYIMDNTFINIQYIHHLYSVFTPHQWCNLIAYSLFLDRYNKLQNKQALVTENVLWLALPFDSTKTIGLLVI
jgi:hypothetical protein